MDTVNLAILGSIVFLLGVMCGMCVLFLLNDYGDNQARKVLERIESGIDPRYAPTVIRQR